MDGWRRTPQSRTAHVRDLQPRRATRSHHASEGAGAATVDAPPTATSLATLLTRHILRDGELVLLLLKPSLWFILLSSLRFVADRRCC